MLKDFRKWVSKNKDLVVNDFENQRYFWRPLTEREKKELKKYG